MCQLRHLQFDSLRRAKHSTVMLHDLAASRGEGGGVGAAVDEAPDCFVIGIGEFIEAHITIAWIIDVR